MKKETLGQSYGPRHRPPAGSWGGAISYERGTHDGLHHDWLEGTSLMQSFTPPEQGFLEIEIKDTQHTGVLQ